MQHIKHEVQCIFKDRLLRSMWNLFHWKSKTRDKSIQHWQIIERSEKIWFFLCHKKLQGQSCFCLTSTAIQWTQWEMILNTIQEQKKTTYRFTDAVSQSVPSYVLRLPGQSSVNAAPLIQSTSPEETKVKALWKQTEKWMSVCQRLSKK